MNQRVWRQRTYIERVSTDPIPLVIMVALIGAAAAFAHLGYQIGLDWGQREREKEQSRRALDSALFAAFRDLQDVTAQHRKFEAFVAEYQLYDEKLGMGRVLLTEGEVAEFHRLLRDIRESGDRLANDLERLREQIREPEHRDTIGKLVLELDENLRSVLTASKFGDFLKLMNKQLSESERLLQRVAKLYDIVLP